MTAHRPKPAVCIVRGCNHKADRPGAARGYCTMHYTRWHRYGVCQRLLTPCERPAIGYAGLCDEHVIDVVAT